MQFKAFEGGIEVNGSTVYSIVDGFGIVKSLAKTYFKQADMDEEIDVNKWYSQEKWLRAFEIISKSHSEEALFKIGLKIPKNAKFPDWIKTIDDAIKSIDFAYHMNHRKNGETMFDPNTGKMLDGIGNYGYQRIPGQNMILSVCKNPYPCFFDRGIITTMAALYEISSKVIHDDTKPCRRSGSDSCTYIISW